MSRPAASPSRPATTSPRTAPPDPNNLPLPPMSPVTLLATPTAATATHAHTALILALFAARFRAVVADPVVELALLAVPLALLQGAYCILCLPPSAAEKQPQTPKRKGIRRETPSAARIVPALLSLTSTLVLALPLLTALAILHGAPLTTHHAETLLLGLHLALLAAPPLFYTSGVRTLPWRALVSLAAPLDETRAAAVGVVLGAWLGAIPIPLDWDRDWQRWPVTVVAGAYGGWAVGKLVGGTVAWGRVVDFE